MTRRFVGQDGSLIDVKMSCMTIDNVGSTSLLHVKLVHSMHYVLGATFKPKFIMYKKY
jgi:hypothetical protein